jgi:hypothetical protein
MADKVEDVNDDINDINTILTCCGFAKENNRINITQDGF